MLNAILFDLDGTLTHTDPVHYQTWFDLLLTYDLKITPEFYKTHFNGRLNQDIVQDLLPHLTWEEGEALSRYKEAEFRRRADQVLQPMPGLMRLLDWIDRHHLQQAVVTNAPRENAEFTLGVLQLRQRFSLVILGDELERGKPDPLPYQVALQRLAIAPEDALVFEDSPAGVRSAVGADIPTVGIASSQDPDQLYAAGAKLVVTDFQDDVLWEMLRSCGMP